MSDVLKVDIWSDIACPWCYIGKRRFEEGVRQHVAAGGRDVEIEYHSFELAPDTPVDFEGTEIDFLVAHKGMPSDRVKAMLDQVTEIASSVGLKYDFTSLQHTNTRKAHRLLHLAKEHGLQSELKERLLKAYFIEGRHVGRDSDLVELAVEVGIDGDIAVEALATGAHEASVAADMRQAAAYGIRGVPFFVIESTYGVSGAQEPDVFAEALRQAEEKTS